MTWTKAREAALERAGRKCEKCGAEWSRAWGGRSMALEVHHRDQDRTNNAPENLQVLCRRCHADVHQRLYRERNPYPSREQAEEALRLVEIRKRARVRGTHLAPRLGLNPTTLLMIEHGRKHMPPGFAADYCFHVSRLSGSPVDYQSFIRGFVPH